MRLRIIVTAYNTGDTIGRTLRSIATQRPAKSIEPFVVVVDDGSSPDEREKIRRAIAGSGLDPARTASIRIRENRGCAGAWAEGERHFSDCEYTTWLDSDDCYAHDEVLLDIERALASGPDMVVFANNDCRAPLRTPRDVAFRHFMMLWEKCVRTDLLGVRHFLDTRIINDFYAHIVLCDLARTVEYVPRNHVAYTNDSPTSISHFRRYGIAQSLSEICRTMSLVCAEVDSLRNEFSKRAVFYHVERMSAHIPSDASLRYGLSSYEAKGGYENPPVVVTYPSLELCPPSFVADRVREISDLMDGDVEFFVPCGSERSSEAVGREIDRAGLRSGRVSVDVFPCHDRYGNGTSSVMGMVREGMRRIPSVSRIAAMVVPAWWRLDRDFDVRLCLSVLLGDTNVMSVMLAGWYWSECGGAMNYYGASCGIDGYRKVRTSHLCDKVLFNANAPQIVRVLHFLDGGILGPGTEMEALDRLCRSNNWGAENKNMVLVPSEGGPAFSDIVGTDPVYRREIIQGKE